MPKFRLTLGHNEAILKIVAGGLGMSCISKLAIEPLHEKWPTGDFRHAILATGTTFIYAGASSKIPGPGSESLYEIL